MKKFLLTPSPLNLWPQFFDQSIFTSNNKQLGKRLSDSHILIIEKKINIKRAKSWLKIKLKTLTGRRIPSRVKYTSLLHIGAETDGNLIKIAT